MLCGDVGLDALTDYYTKEQLEEMEDRQPYETKFGVGIKDCEEIELGKWTYFLRWPYKDVNDKEVRTEDSYVNMLPLRITKKHVMFGRLFDQASYLNEWDTYERANLILHVKREWIENFDVLYDNAPDKRKANVDMAMEVMKDDKQGIVRAIIVLEGVNLKKNRFFYQHDLTPWQTTLNKIHEESQCDRETIQRTFYFEDSIQKWKPRPLPGTTPFDEQVCVCVFIFFKCIVFVFVDA